ncbi:MAG: DUF805 domain-containing protein [Methylocella sp.]
MTTLPLVYPSINLGIKRYHDRGKSGWWVFICWGPIISIIIIGFLRGIQNPSQSDWPEQLTPVMQLIPFVVVIGWLWYFIETGFLRGTKGPNEYGPDLLVEQAMRFARNAPTPPSI